MKSKRAAQPKIEPARTRPTGLVAFLFSDIEGSTQRWDAHREAMQAAVRCHDALMRGAIERHHGFVFKTIGDAFCAAFATASEAVDAALDAQREIGAADWSAVEGLRVRMAIHVGVADERDNDYFGPTVNRVARLLAIGHGGQVLLSDAAADRVRARLGEGEALLDLGRHHLKDLVEPEAVGQLLAPGLARDFPPLHSLAHLRHNVPEQLTSFVGRAAELAEVTALLREHRLVTLVGTGGVGKTRLAEKIGAELIGEFADGAWFVSFAAIADGGLAIGAIAAALGLRESLNRPMLETLLINLRHKRALLILDNCEHLLVPIATAANDILQACPGITILATTREALDVPGERRYGMPALPTPAQSQALSAPQALGYGAIALFVERAREADPHFIFDDAGALVVADVCRQLDGIALAIELAAARLAMLSLEALAQHLDQRFRLLTGGSRAALPRQQTLHALIDWSYDLLDERERTIFARLAVFAGSFSPERAQATCSDATLDDFDVLECLAALVAKSLLVVDVDAANRRRYRFLASIRAYAGERLAASPEASAVRRRHAAAMADFADAAYREFDTDPQPDWLARCELELHDARAAMAWGVEEGGDAALAARIASGMGVAFLRLVLLREGTQWCERVLAKGGPLEATVDARLHYVFSMLCNNQGRYADALAASQRALESFRAGGDDRGGVRALAQVAQQLARAGRQPEAIEAGDAAIAAARSLGDRAVLASVLARYANIFGPDAIDAARARYTEALEIYRQLERTKERTRVAYWLADSEVVAGNFGAAARLIEEDLGDVTGDVALFVRVMAAFVYRALRDPARAASAAREVLTLANESHDPIQLAYALTYVAMLAAESDAESAGRLLGYAQRQVRDLGPPIASCERALWDSFRGDLEERLGSARLVALEAEGAGLSEDAAVKLASRF